MSQQKGGAIVGRGERGGWRPEDRAPPGSVTPPTLSPHRPVTGTGNHKASLGDSRLSSTHLHTQPRGGKQSCFRTSTPAKHLHLVSQREPRNPASPRGPSHFSQDAPALSAFGPGLRAPRGAEEWGVVNDNKMKAKGWC